MENNENYERTLEENVSNVGRKVKQYLPTIFAVGIALVFIFNGMVEITATTLSLKEQVELAIITIFAGYSISTLIADQGYDSAKNSKDFLKEKEEYNVEVRNGIRYRKQIEKLSIERCFENQKDTRRQILENANLIYEEVFDENGHLKPSFDITKYKHIKQYGKCRKAFKKAVNLRIYKINVFGDADVSNYGIKKPTTEIKHRIQTSTIKMVFKAIFGVACVGVTFDYIGLSWGSFIYAFMQVAIWSGMGFMDRLKNYRWFMENILPPIQQKKLLIREYLSMSEEDKQKYETIEGGN